MKLQLFKKLTKLWLSAQVFKYLYHSQNNTILDNNVNNNVIINIENCALYSTNVSNKYLFNLQSSGNIYTQQLRSAANGSADHQQQHYRQSLTLDYRSLQQRNRQRRDRFLVVFRYFCATVAFVLAVACVIYMLHTMGWFFAVLIALIALLLTRSWRWFYIAGATAKRDLT